MAWCAYAEFARSGRIPSLMARASVPRRWLPWLASAKVVALPRLVVGFWVPLIGTAAALGVASYVVGAIITRVVARDSTIAGTIVCLLLACTALTLRVAASAALGLGIVS